MITAVVKTRIKCFTPLEAQNLNIILSLFMQTILTRFSYKHVHEPIWARDVSLTIE